MKAWLLRNRWACLLVLTVAVNVGVAFPPIVACQYAIHIGWLGNWCFVLVLLAPLLWSLYAIHTFRGCLSERIVVWLAFLISGYWTWTALRLMLTDIGFYLQS